MRRIIYFIIAALTVVLFAGCSDDASKNGSGDTDTALTGDPNSTDPNSTDPNSTDPNSTDSTADSDTGWYSSTCHVAECAGSVWACGDCIDNDSDGKIDAADDNCLGPCDNNEAGFDIDIPGANVNACTQECYFDNNSGGGNDGCVWDHRCDTFQPQELSPACTYTKTIATDECNGWLADQTTQCLDVCIPIVPNGCDCFGCCQIGGTGDYLFIGTPGCTIENIENCDKCTPVPSCINTCGKCELCLGKTTIPDSCFTDTDSDSDTTVDTDTDNIRCAAGVAACGLPTDPACPVGKYCITGCCTSVLIN